MPLPLPLPPRLLRRRGKRISIREKGSERLFVSLVSHGDLKKFPLPANRPRPDPFFSRCSHRGAVTSFHRYSHRFHRSTIGGEGEGEGGGGGRGRGRGEPRAGVSPSLGEGVAFWQRRRRERSGDRRGRKTSTEWIHVVGVRTVYGIRARYATIRYTDVYGARRQHGSVLAAEFTD